jgi:hypothetical protein
MPAVHGNLIQLDGQIAGFGYWFEHFITAAFWVAIILGFIRITSMAVMAMIQKVRSSI